MSGWIQATMQQNTIHIHFAHKNIKSDQRQDTLAKLLDRTFSPTRAKAQNSFEFL